MTRSAQEIQDWIVARISALTKVPAREIHVSEPFLRYGLDSVAVVALVAELEDWLGYRFTSDPLEDHATVEALARFLAEQTSGGARHS
jgi:acyl carrier protein